MQPPSVVIWSPGPVHRMLRRLVGHQLQQHPDLAQVGLGRVPAAPVTPSRTSERSSRVLRICTPTCLLSLISASMAAAGSGWTSNTMIRAGRRARQERQLRRSPGACPALARLLVVAERGGQPVAARREHHAGRAQDAALAPSGGERVLGWTVDLGQRRRGWHLSRGRRRRWRAPGRRRLLLARRPTSGRGRHDTHQQQGALRDHWPTLPRKAGSCARLRTCPGLRAPSDARILDGHGVDRSHQQRGDRSRQAVARHQGEAGRSSTSTASCGASTSTRTSSCRRSSRASASATSCSAGTRPTSATTTPATPAGTPGTPTPPRASICRPTARCPGTTRCRSSWPTSRTTAAAPLGVCPRQLLKRVIDRRATRPASAPLTSLEYEWFNFRETPQSLADKGYAAPAAADAGHVRLLRICG